MRERKSVAAVYDRRPARFGRRYIEGKIMITIKSMSMN
jgi:hypothetical protein